MLYIFHGTDSARAREAKNAFVSDVCEKTPDAEVFLLDSEQFSRERFEELLASRGLFDARSIVVCEGLLAHPPARECIKEQYDSLADSNSIFVFLDEEIPKDMRLRLEKSAVKVFEFTADVSGKRQAESFFALADALGARDKKQLWILLQDAYGRGDVPEKLHGLLIWQMKNLTLVKQSIPQGQGALRALGLNPYVLKKTAFFCKNYSEEELKTLSRELVSLYHEAHRGGLELDTSLERWVLSL